MTAEHVDELWRAAMKRVAAEGGVPLVVFAETVRAEARAEALEEAARLVEQPLGPVPARAANAIAGWIRNLRAA